MSLAVLDLELQIFYIYWNTLPPRQWRQIRGLDVKEKVATFSNITNHCKEVQQTLIIQSRGDLAEKFG